MMLMFLLDAIDGAAYVVANMQTLIKNAEYYLPSCWLFWCASDANVVAVASADDVLMMMIVMFPRLVFAYKKTVSDYMS